MTSELARLLRRVIDFMKHTGGTDDKPLFDDVCAAEAAALSPAPGDAEAVESALSLKTTPAMRDRLRELSTKGNTDDYDRVVLMLLDDFASCITNIAILADSQKRASPAIEAEKMREAKPELTVAQWATLREMKSYLFGYRFRQATCRSLAELGYAQRMRSDVKRPPYKITDAGRAALKEEKAS